MKKLTLAIALAALVIFAGCKKDKETEGTTLKASIEQYKSGDSKTSIVPVDANTAEIRWTAGDKIIVNNGTTSGTFTLTSGAGSTEGTFTYNGEYTLGDDNIAVYPETATISGNTLTVTLPAEQTYAAERNGSTPMLGTFTDPEDLTFTSLCGALGISLTGTDIAITAIEVVSKLNETLNGEFTCTTTDAALNVATTDDPTMQKVRLNCATTLTAEAQVFYFAMPVGALSGGFTLNVYNEGADPIYTKETTNDITIELNKVNQMPDFTIDNAIDLSKLQGNYEAQNGDVLINALSGDYKITVAAGATITLRNATINRPNNQAYTWAGLNCLGDANIILQGTNNIKGFYEDYPGIHIAEGYTLTIGGDGSLTASSNDWGAGIGGGVNLSCGNIVINSDTINATGGTMSSGIGAGCGNRQSIYCGDITINGGTVTAQGGRWAAGIGSGAGFGGEISISTCGTIRINGGTVIATGGDGGNAKDFFPDFNYEFNGGAGIGTGSAFGPDFQYLNTGTSNCGDIIIESGVTSVTATKGSGAINSIGKNDNLNPGTCGTVTIGGTTYGTGVTPNQSDGKTYIYP